MQHKIETIVDGEHAFLQATKLELEGTHKEIGAFLTAHALGELPLSQPPPKPSPAIRGQRQFIKRHWPAHYQRMLGAAEALNVNPESDLHDLSVLLYGVGTPGCSVVFYPPPATKNNAAVLSRNFDYTTGRVQGFNESTSLVAPPGEATSEPSVSRPFLIHSRPEQGFDCLFMCAYDLLGGATDGMNSEGLAVALMADVGTLDSEVYQPHSHTGVGINEMQTVRFLLENCATARQARQLLLNTQQIYLATPCHYLIADASGDAFIWEFSPRRTAPHITEMAGKPLVCTNHLVYQGAPTNPELTTESRDRYQRLSAKIADRQGTVSEEFIREVNRSVEATDPAGAGQYVSDDPARTLWYAYYNLSDRSLNIDFYLGEQSGHIVRSESSRHQL